MLEILLNAEGTVEGSYAKQLTYKSREFPNLFTVALCCTISVNEITGAGLMKKKCKHKYIYIGMQIKQHQIFLMKSTHIALQKAEIYVKS